MADYPNTINEPRVVENKPGRTYQPELLTRLFAEDINNLSAETVAIETELGTNPSGSSSDVAARFTALDTTVSEKLKKTDVIGSSTDYVTTGINVNASTRGRAILLIASRNTGAGDSTAAALYLIRLGYSGDYYSAKFIAGTDFILFQVTSSILEVKSNTGNFRCTFCNIV